MKKILYGLILFAIMLSTSLSAKTIHISKNGSNQSPYDTWSKAATSLTTGLGNDLAGDTILIGRGTFYNSQIIPPTGSTRPDMTYYLDSAYVANGSNNYSGLAIINGGDSIPKSSWVSQGNNVYRAIWVGSSCDNEDGAGGKGYVATQDEVLLEPQLSISGVNASGEFYHDLATDYVYVRCFGDVNPNTTTIVVACKSPVKFNATGQNNIFFGGLDIRTGKRAAVLFVAGSDSSIFRHCKLSRTAYCQTCNPAVVMSNQHGDSHDSTGNWNATYNLFNVFTNCSLGVAIAPEGEGTIAHRGSGFIGYDISETTFDSCVFHNLPGDGLEVKNSYASTAQRIVERLYVKFSKFENIGGEGVNLYTNAYACSLYGNIFVNCDDAGILIGNSSSGNDDRGNHVIFNNTFYRCNAGLQVQTPYAINTGQFKYNLIYDLVPGPYGYSYNYDFRDNVSGLTISIDSNQHYGETFSALWSGSEQTWSTWQSAGRDANGSIVNPGLDPNTFATASASTMNRNYGGVNWTRYGAIQAPLVPCDTISAPTLSSPIDGATNQAVAITLDWDDLAGSDAYQIQIDNNSNFASPEVTVQSASSQYISSPLVGGTTYYWRVRGHDSCSWGFWSVSRFFTTICDIPTAPTLLSPTNTVTNVSIGATLDWATVLAANSYSIVVDDNSDFSTPLISTSVVPSQYTASGLSYETQYYWRVATVNGCGTSSWSSQWSFTTGSEPISSSSEICTLIVTSDGNDTRIYDGAYGAGAISGLCGFGSGSNASVSNLYDNIPIVSGQLIDSAFAFFTAKSDGADNFCNMRIVAEDALSPTPPADLADFAARIRSTTYVNWPQIQNFTSGNVYKSTDIGDVIQWLVNRPGYAYGGSGQIFFDNNNSDGGVFRQYGLFGNDPIYIIVYSSSSNIAPTAPTLAEPFNGVYVSLSKPTLLWNNSVDTYGDVITYRVELATDNLFSSIVEIDSTVTENTNQTQWQPDSFLLHNTTYYWRVRGSDGLLTSDYSTTRNFTIWIGDKPPLKKKVGKK